MKVKVLAITPEGKINLSIKRAQEGAQAPAAERRARPAQTQRSSTPRSANHPSAGTPQGVVHGPTGDASFEDRLKHFMQESDSRIAGNRLNSDRNRGRRRGKG